MTKMKIEPQLPKAEQRKRLEIFSGLPFPNYESLYALLYKPNLFLKNRSINEDVLSDVKRGICFIQVFEALVVGQFDVCNVQVVLSVLISQIEQLIPQLKELLNSSQQTARNEISANNLFIPSDNVIEWSQIYRALNEFRVNFSLEGSNNGVCQLQILMARTYMAISGIKFDRQVVSGGKRYGALKNSIEAGKETLRKYERGYKAMLSQSENLKD